MNRKVVALWAKLGLLPCHLEKRYAVGYCYLLRSSESAQMWKAATDRE